LSTVDAGQGGGPVRPSDGNGITALPSLIAPTCCRPLRTWVTAFRTLIAGSALVIASTVRLLGQEDFESSERALVLLARYAEPLEHLAERA